MPRMPPAFRPDGRTAEQAERLYDRERGSAAVRLYGRAWRTASRHHLHSSPLCVYCALDGRVTTATLVDHLYPHRGDRAVFWMRCWWMSACKPCHDGFKQSVECKGRGAIDALARRLGAPLYAEAVRAAK